MDLPYHIEINQTICRPSGPKTVFMVAQLGKGSLLNYDPKRQTLLHQNTSYYILKGSTRNISKKPIVYISSFPTVREIISLNPLHSPVLKNLYHRLFFLLKEKTPLQKALEITTSFIKEEVFSSKQSLEQLDAFIEEWKQTHPRTDFTPTKEGEDLAVIPLDDFLRARMGVCRHFALAAAYLLDRLLPSGHVHVVRDIIDTPLLYGGHAWNIFVSEDGLDAWHIDTYWDIIKDLNSPQDRTFLYQAYGKEAIDREIQRFAPTGDILRVTTEW